MSRRREVFDDALSLPIAERARLARALIVSLDEEPEDPAAVAREWDDVIVRRVAEIKAGTAKTEPWSAVEARIKQRVRRTRRRSDH